MKNVTDILVLKYYQLLSIACTPVPVFRDGYVPNDLIEPAYVMVSTIDNSDNGTMQSDDTITSIQVGIYTSNTTDNNTTLIADMSTIIYQTIKPGTINTLFLAGVQVLSTEFAGEQNPAPFDTGSRLFINRFITFRHKIFHQ